MPDVTKLNSLILIKKILESSLGPISFPIISRVMPRLLATDIVSVQPMSAPTGIIFYADYSTDYKPIFNISALKKMRLKKPIMVYRNFYSETPYMPYIPGQLAPPIDNGHIETT